MSMKKWILILSAGLLGLCARAAAQPMTLEEVIGEARTQSVQALWARAAFDDSIWKQEDPASALMNKVASADIAFLYAFWETRQMRAVGVMCNGVQRNGPCFGVERHGKWAWFALEQGKALREPVCLEGDALVCLVDPALLDTLDPALREKIVNPQVLDGVTEDSNYLLAKLHIK